MKPLPAEAIPKDAVLDHLRKVLGSELFKSSERSSSLLRFLVEKTVSGEADRLKEYTLGTEALGKNQAFDPRTDPIVRAEVSRLRARLDKYYATEGKDDALTIALPKGSYIPGFQKGSLPAPAKAPGRPKPSLSARITWFAVAFGVVGFAFALVVGWGIWRLPVPDNVVSIAVLPFANLSADPEQEFFSAGMTEEITTALAKIPDLHVVGRTSAFQFKSQTQDLHAIGQALSATHLLEGSVRKEGERVRITAQLIQADNGVHVWSESYDRQLTGIFAIQEDIATAIAGALRIPLGLKPGERLVSSRTNDLESYQQFLRLRAPAWGLLASAYAQTAIYDVAIMSRPVEETRHLVQSGREKGEKAAREAIRLDARQASGYPVLAVIERSRKNWVAAEDLLRKALTLDPNDNEVLSANGSLLGLTGRVTETLQLREQVRALEPFVPIYNTWLATALLLNGQNEGAIQVLEAEPPTGNVQIGFRNETLARAYAAVGRFDEAADAILTIPKDRYGDTGKSIENAARLLRRAPMEVTALETLPVLPGRLNFVYAYIGAPNRVMEYPERELEAGIIGTGLRFLFEPSSASVRKTERFKAFVRKVGLVDYWRARGWPEFCRPTSADDFACN